MIQGSLNRLHLGDLLQWLQMGNLSGRLTLQEKSRRRHIDLLDGEIVYVSSTVPDERLASWLATEGLLPVSQLRRLLATSLLRRTLFTGLLIDQGGFSPENLRRSLTRLAQTITGRVLVAPDVHFVLDPSYPVKRLLGMTLHVEPNILLMEAARHTDEAEAELTGSEAAELPFTGEAFDAFFWQLIREGIVEDGRVDGEELATLQELIRDIMATLSEWLCSGPGLVPMPENQTEILAAQCESQDRIDLNGLPHAVWNQMVLACSIRSPHLQHPETLQELADQAAELAVWKDIISNQDWRRPQAGSIDQLTSSVASSWCRTAGAAAPHIGAVADAARLAVHLILVPTDLVMWTLATLPLPHRRLRSTLVRELPRRLGWGLAHMADFPQPIRLLFDRMNATPLGTCLHLGREVLPSAQIWPATVPDDQSLLLSVASAAVLTQAAAAAREVVSQKAGSSAAAS